MNSLESCRRGSMAVSVWAAEFRRRTMFRTLFILLALTATACAGDENEQPRETSLEGLGAELADAQCEKIFRCCTEDELDTVFSGVTVETVEQCNELVEGNARVFLVPSLEKAANAGSVILDSAQRASCIRALREQACGTFSPSPNLDLFTVETCREFVAPALETSEFCAEDFECESDFCSRAPGSTEGSCTIAPVDQQPCLNERCGPGHYCSLVDSICLPRLAIGETCERNEECESNNCLDQMGVRTCGEPALACMES